VEGREGRGGGKPKYSGQSLGMRRGLSKNYIYK